MIDYSLIEFMNERVKATPTDFRRYLYHEINWDAHMIGITGPRGIGKSTLVLQHLISNPESDKILYVTADHMYFSTHSLVELASDFIKAGGKRLCIDEVHKYSGWSRELKQIYDGYPSLQIIFTGSSVLDINKGEADLSRRALMYHMQGLSFREYLKLFHNIDSGVYTLNQIIAGEVKIPKLEHPLPLFKKYLKEGYYPFALEGDFARRIMQVVSLTVEGDIPMYADMKAVTARKIKRMLGIIAESAPYKPSIENLAVEIGVSKNNIPDYLIWLEKAGMIAQLIDDTKGMRSLGKVEKVFIDNPTLQSALGRENANIGNLRETFFYNQMRVRQEVVASKISDFRIGDLTFEIGGKSKGQRQIQGTEKGYVIKDDIEYPYGNIIPLYHFGFNY